MSAEKVAEAQQRRDDNLRLGLRSLERSDSSKRLGVLLRRVSAAEKGDFWTDEYVAQLQALAEAVDQPQPGASEALDSPSPHTKVKKRLMKAVMANTVMRKLREEAEGARDKWHAPRRKPSRFYRAEAAEEEAEEDSDPPTPEPELTEEELRQREAAADAKLLELDRSDSALDRLRRRRVRTDRRAERELSVRGRRTVEKLTKLARRRHEATVAKEARAKPASTTVDEATQLRVMTRDQLFERERVRRVERLLPFVDEARHLRRCASDPGASKAASRVRDALVVVKKRLLAAPPDEVPPFAAVLRELPERQLVLALAALEEDDQQRERLLRALRPLATPSERRGLHGALRAALTEVRQAAAERLVSRGLRRKGKRKGRPSPLSLTASPISGSAAAGPVEPDSPSEIATPRTPKARSLIADAHNAPGDSLAQLMKASSDAQRAEEAAAAAAKEAAAEQRRFPDLLQGQLRDNALTALDDGHDHVSRLVQEGTRESLRGNEAVALQKLTRAIDLHPRDARARFQRGVAHQRAGNAQAAYRDFCAARRLQPGNALVHYNCGVVSTTLGRFRRAVAHLSRALELQPKDAEALYARAVAHRRLDNFIAAHADYGRYRALAGVSLSPSSAAAAAAADKEDDFQLSRVDNPADGQYEITLTAETPLVRALRTRARKRSPEQIELLISMTDLEALTQYSVATQRQLWGMLELVTVPPDERVFDTGDTATHMYVIYSGAVAVRIKRRVDLALGNAEREDTLTVLHDGRSFGSDALAAGSLRTAACVTEQRSQLLQLSREDYIASIGKLEEEAYQEKRRFFRSIDVCRDWTSAQIDSIALHSREERYPRHACIVKQKSRATTLYFIVSGVVDVYRTLTVAGEREPIAVRLGSLSSGDVFGENTVLDPGGGTNEGTIKATMHTRVLSLLCERIDLEQWGDSAIHALQEHAFIYPAVTKIMQMVQDKRDLKSTQQAIVKEMERHRRKREAMAYQKK